MGFSEKEIGRMTFRKWKLLYQEYKNNYDIELTLMLSKQRYFDLEKEQTLDDVMPI